MFNKTFNGIFGLTKKEFNGVLVLCVLIMLVLVLPDVYEIFQDEPAQDFTRLNKQVALLNDAEKKQQTEYKNQFFTRQNEHGIAEDVKLFAFDPNHLPDEKWRQLGLSPKQIKVLKNYEAKGGRFRKKEDLEKIYSISAQDYQRLQPYIRIPEEKDKFPVSGSKPFLPVKNVVAEIIEINSADSARLTDIKGVGPAFASRIIKYRNRLGGFNSKFQLLEVFGIDSEKYAGIEKQVKVDAALKKTLNINTAEFDDLKRNPYLSFKQMNAIIQYRRQHGPYKSMDDLRQVAILNAEILRKIEPYIAFQ